MGGCCCVTTLTAIIPHARDTTPDIHTLPLPPAHHLWPLPPSHLCTPPPASNAGILFLVLNLATPWPPDVSWRGVSSPALRRQLNDYTPRVPTRSPIKKAVWYYKCALRAHWHRVRAGRRGS